MRCDPRAISTIPHLLSRIIPFRPTGTIFDEVNEGETGPCDGERWAITKDPVSPLVAFRRHGSISKQFPLPRKPDELLL